MSTWYKTGTVAYTNGQTIVTGSGAGLNWIEAGIQPGDSLRLPSREFVEITAILSSNQLEIAEPYLAATSGGHAYTIKPTTARDIQLLQAIQALTGTFAAVRDGIGAGRFPKGTLTAPAGRFQGDEDTGFDSTGENELAFITAGALRLLIDGANNLLFGGGETPVFAALNRTTVQIDGVGGSLLAFRTGDENRGYIFALPEELALEANPGVGLKISTLGPQPILIVTSNSEKWRFLPSGMLLGAKTVSDPTAQGIEIDRAGTYYATSVSTIAGYFNRLSSDGTILSFNRQSTQVGTITVSATGTAYNTSSDYRLKDVEGPLTGSGDFIDRLKPVRGTWKEGGQTFIGLIAHEVQEVCETQVATGEQDGKEMQALAYGAPEIMAHVIAELQSLRARTTAVEAQNEEMAGTISALQARISTLEARG